MLSQWYLCRYSTKGLISPEFYYKVYGTEINCDNDKVIENIENVTFYSSMSSSETMDGWMDKQNIRWTNKRVFDDTHVFNKAAYLTQDKRFHETLNLFQVDWEIMLESVLGSN